MDFGTAFAQYSQDLNSEGSVGSVYFELSLRIHRL
jgi:hypothetical protein